MAVERRIEINQIDALVRDVLAENVEIVPEIQLVHDTTGTTRRPPPTIAASRK